MRFHIGPLVGLLAPPLLCALAVPAPAQESIKLTPRAYKKWTYILPNETWTKASTTIPIPHTQSEGFATIQRGPYLVVDTNGDGEVNKEVKGAFGFVKLRSYDAEGRSFVYGVRFRSSGKTWEYSVSGTMHGKLKGVSVQVIDANTNGIYDEYGVDGMIVGGGKAVSYLSKVVNVKGELYTFEISKDGRTAKFTPYEGETGVLDLRSKFRSKGKLASAVVSDRSRQISFEVAAAKGGMTVPAGEYSIAAGLARKTSESARIRAGTMPDLNVEPGQKLVLAWGGPLKAKFDYSVTGERITVPASVRYVGKAGEEYYDWVPDAKSPKILVLDAKSAKLLTAGRFPSC